MEGKREGRVKYQLPHISVSVGRWEISWGALLKPTVTLK